MRRWRDVGADPNGRAPALRRVVVFLIKVWYTAPRGAGSCVSAVASDRFEAGVERVWETLARPLVKAALEAQAKRLNGLLSGCASTSVCAS